MPVVAAIHQPNFFPWLGFFRKIAAAEIFVLLDCVAYPKSSWVNRVKLRIGGEARWVTCPVRRPAAGTEIRTVEIDETPPPWRRKIIGALEMNYGRAAHYDEVMPWVRRMLDRDEPLMAEYNAGNILELSRALGLTTRIVRQSELRRPEIFRARGSERLAWICREVGADVYLAGDGAEGYEDLAAYRRAGIAFRRMRFVHPEYAQGGRGSTFVPGLSVLDALLHLGTAGVATLLWGAGSDHASRSDA